MYVYIYTYIYTHTHYSLVITNLTVSLAGPVFRASFQERWLRVNLTVSLQNDATYATFVQGASRDQC